MYTTYFGLKENPFNLTPDPRYLFLSPNHREALDHLLYGINERKGFIAITGGIGTGKTTLCRALLAQLNESVKSALIFNSYITENELLPIVNHEFGVEQASPSGTKKEYIDKLNQFLLATFSKGGNAVLLIDEAQNLSHTVLEQIRMLSNLETDKEKLIQIVLAGQSELKELLASPSLRQLNERITVRYELRPLNRMDVRGYVEHRLVVGGARGDLRFTSGAFKEIYRYSQGNPRRINAVCDRSLLIAYAEEKHTVSRGMVGKAVDEIRGDIAAEHGREGWSWRKFVSSTVLLLLVIMIVGYASWTFREHILGIISPLKKAAAVTERLVPPRAVKPEKEKTSLFLDEKTSLAGLFDLFSRKQRGEGLYGQDGAIGIVTFAVEPKYYRMFKKPFRILLAHSGSSGPPPTNQVVQEKNLTPAPRYLLIQEAIGDRAILLDAEGKTRQVTMDFLETRRGQRVSWIYRREGTDIDLAKGMSYPGVLKVQHTLKNLGYRVETTGLYDDATFRGVRKFQAYFGLDPDGIVGPRTRAFLYQVSD